MYLYIFFVSLEAVHVHLYMYFSKPRGCHFIFLSLETVTCMCTYFSIFSKPWAVYVSGFGH